MIQLAKNGDRISGGAGIGVVGGVGAWFVELDSPALAFACLASRRFLVFLAQSKASGLSTGGERFSEEDF